MMARKLIIFVLVAVALVIVFGGEMGGGAAGAMLGLWLFWELARVMARIVRGAYRMGGR